MSQETKDQKWKPTIGCYCMHHMHGEHSGTPVIIDSVKDGYCSIRYVSIHPDGHVMCGGSSSYWAQDEFTPMVDPRLIAAAKCLLAKEEAENLQRKVYSLRKDADEWGRAVLAIVEAQKEAAIGRGGKA